MKSITAAPVRQLPPPLGDPRVTSFPRFRREKLGDGSEVWALRRTGVPLIDVVWVATRAGAEADPAGREGLAALAAACLDEGTSRLSSVEIANRLERLGGSLSSSADWEAGYVQAHVLGLDLEAALDLVAEVVFGPVFPEHEVERLRARKETDLLRRRDQPAALAEEHLIDLVYPAGHRYKTLLGGDEASVPGLRRADCQEMHRDRWLGGPGRLLVVGDIDPDRAITAARSAFGSFEAHGKPDKTTTDLPRLPSVGASRVRLVDRPGSTQTELRIGHAGVSRTDPDRPVLRVLNALLGGKFTSRINLNLRERHGFTYGASSRWAARRGPGPFAVAAAVANESVARAATEVLRELDHLREEMPPLAETEDAKSYLLGIFPYTLQGVGDLTNYLADLATFDLPEDEPDREQRRLRDVSPEDILRVAQRHLTPESAQIVAVGPIATLREAFAAGSWESVEETTGPPIDRRDRDSG